MHRLTLCALALASAAGFAQAAPAIDGTRDAEYGSALAVQTVNTGFGDNQSELDAAYARLADNKLYLFFSGNLQDNFNKFELFIDSHLGGQHTLLNNNPNVDFDGLNRLAGLTFDSGFSADHYITLGRDSGTIFVNYAKLGTGGGSGLAGFLGSVSTPNANQQGSGTVGGTDGLPSIQIGYNNANTDGVNGNSGTPADVVAAAAVGTGLEIAINLADLGITGNSVGVTAFVNAVGHDFLSNQVLGGLPSDAGNLGDPANVNFGNQAGSQVFTVAIPEPTSLALVGLGAMGLLLRRRRD